MFLLNYIKYTAVTDIIFLTFRVTLNFDYKH